MMLGYNRPSFVQILATAFAVAGLVNTGIGAVLETSIPKQSHVIDLNTEALRNDTPSIDTRGETSVPSSVGDFPICTTADAPFLPFCLPQNGTDVMADAAYYVTWNSDYYPLNATITIELRYSNSSLGDSAFTSEKTANSYGYITLYMRKEWLQGKPRNEITLYIIELDPASGRRASARQGPTITLHPKPVEHYKPPPQLPFNKVALCIGLPVSLGVVILVVAGLYFGMRERRKIAVGNVMGSRGRWRGTRKSEGQPCLDAEGTIDIDRLDGFRALRKYSDEYSEASTEIKEVCFRRRVPTEDH